ncbi:TRAP transporter large permease subunit [Roseomonas alkaliterrae]|jgi:tripartite ATP-independent transporter DctM subunit|uniref:TRAP transporter large permease protein n=1 Tax=Neoroseomonas alkaliterrae TaxID=1452450 RepID=A0A840XS70_9PROT|nr:TRAP transporter large permease subunit [Neoroseomonas alkaliterrae]MBB5691508.1 tripartite ATP-independent transporter DctM subunit [Neoroseomonas alkaliterrae]MBR0676573.1 TRAP transporter large permease subunit [Neoroseomonas alkaliterrae]
MISLEWMPPLMFGGLVVFLLLGFPVAFSLSAVGLFFGFLSIELGFFTPAYLGNLPLRVFGILSNEVLLAIPFFTLMGAILERCGLAEDLLEGTGQLFGKVPGGLAYAVIVVGAILGAITGTVAASVIAMGMISLPIMLRYGYDMRIATGVIAASGTIAQLIPPSLVLIVLGDQLGKSVGDMYAGAVGPAMMQVLLFLAFIAVVSLIWPQKVPPLPEEARTIRGWPLYWRVIKGMVPSLVLMFLVLGTIFLGLATPTEAGAMGAMGAIVVAVINRRFTWALLFEAMGNTMRITAMVIFILIGATVFTLVFQGVDGSIWIEHLLSHLPGGQTGFLVAVNIAVFLLAFFLDFFEIAFIVVPLLVPVAQKLDINLVWFGVLLCVNLQTSFMHPPFGFALFYLRGVAPKEVLTKDIYWGAIPFLCLQLTLVAIVIMWPESVTYWLDRGTGVDPASVRIEVPAPEPQQDEVPVFR